MALRGEIMNFKFFEVIGGVERLGVGVDPAVLNSGLCNSVDTKGYETAAIMFTFGTLSQLGSLSDGIEVILEHASNSLTGPNAIGTWSRCSEEHVYGVDYFRMHRAINHVSWLILDELTRDSYMISIPATTNRPTIADVESGMCMYIGLSITSIASADYNTIFNSTHTPWVGYRGPYRWIRMRFSARVAAMSAGSFDVTAIAVLGKPADWPVVDVGHPMSFK